MPLHLVIVDLDKAAKTIADAIDRHTAELSAINTTFKELGKIMHEEVAAFLTRIDTATDAIAARLDKLISESNMPADLKAKFEAEVERLEAMGKDPTNPIPDVPPA